MDMYMRTNGFSCCVNSFGVCINTCMAFGTFIPVLPADITIM